jgi:integrase
VLGAVLSTLSPSTERPLTRRANLGGSARTLNHGVQPTDTAEALHAYIQTAGIADDRRGWLFRTAPGHKATELTNQPLAQADAWRMLRRRAVAAGITAPIGNHTFRATSITAYLANGGALEHAQEMAAHESPRTTKLYNRTKERLTQDEVERIRL